MCVPGREAVSAKGRVSARNGFYQWPWEACQVGKG